MARRSYDKQFKMAAVKLVLEDNMTVAEVSKELDIHYNSLYRWISEYEEYGESAFPGHGTALYSYQYEILFYPYYLPPQIFYHILSVFA